MKKAAIIIMCIVSICTAAISCNNNDTSHAGIPDTTKVSIDTPKAVIVDSSKHSDKDSAH